MSEKQWCWAYSSEDERWNGPCDSREQAIAEANHEGSIPVGDSFVVARCAYPDPAKYVDFDVILERANEDAVDNGCFGDDYVVFDIESAEVPEAKRELAEWARKHLGTRYFSVDMATVETVVASDETEVSR